MVAAYAFFASHGAFTFEPITWDQGFNKPGEGFYASQAEGFLRGETSMGHRPDPRLMALPNPYDYGARHDNQIPYLWDASYFNGRYYLYFSPLPALLLHIPYRFLIGRYPHDTFSGLFFAAWAFAMSAAFVWRALRMRRRATQLPLWLWLLMLGAGNLIPTVIVFCRTYEIAILCGAAMSATFAYTLLLFLERPTNSRLIWTSVWLALTIAARPNLGLLLFVFVAALLIKRRADWVKAGALALIPLAITATSMLAYNHARFGQFLEFGVRYQLTYQNMAEHRVCSCRTPREALRLINTAGVYVGAPVLLGGEFPFASLPLQNLDPAVSFNQYTDRMAGLGVVVPAAMAGTLFAALLALRKRGKDDVTRAGTFVVAGGWLALLGLSTCWYASARYELDFMLLITAGSIVCIEAALSWLADAGLTTRPLRIALIILATYSIVLGLLLGFNGGEGVLLKELFG